MGFKPITEVRGLGTNYNSKVSENFKLLYDKLRYEEYKAKEEQASSKTIAPSSFRCDRISYFRLRGVDPDPVLDVDIALNFKAMLGTACHEDIQRLLSTSIGDQWIDVEDYLNWVKPPYKYEVVKDGYESKITFQNPPIRFACDGIVKIGQEYYLLEIKTSEYSSFKELNKPKDQHIDQVICYCSLLGLKKALVLYIERSTGETKCFEVNVSNEQVQETFDRIHRVMQSVEDNVAPPRLPNGDYWCTFCKYKKRCKQWG